MGFKEKERSSVGTEKGSGFSGAYFAPQVVFVPLQIEERLLACIKGSVQGGGTCTWGDRGS